MKNSLPVLIISILWLGSLSLALAPYFFLGQNTDSVALKYALLIAAAPIFALSFILLAGLLSKIGQKGIVRGIFPRKAFHPVYFLRRVYGGCWTQLFYFKPLYSIALAIPVLKTLTFRLFGYKAESTNFVVYPDTWIRDLPMLNIGEGAYLSNRATIGTNICLSDGNIMVDHVIIGKNSLIGHLAIIGPTYMGEKSEIGVGAAMGVRVKIGNNVHVGPRAGIGHGTKINDGSSIGQMSHIGTKVIIGEDIKVPAGANIPNGAIILSQNDVSKFISSETQLLDNIKEAFKNQLVNDMQDVS